MSFARHYRSTHDSRPETGSTAASNSAASSQPAPSTVGPFTIQFSGEEPDPLSRMVAESILNMLYRSSGMTNEEIVSRLNSTGTGGMTVSITNSVD